MTHGKKLKKLILIFLAFLPALPAASVENDDKSMRYKNIGQNVSNDPLIGPLVRCYQSSYEGSINQLVHSSATERKYISTLLLIGGFQAIALDVKDKCNGWYLKNAKIYGNKIEVIEVWGKLFQAYAKEHDQVLFNDCAKKPDTEWQNSLGKLCTIARKNLR